MFMFDAKVATVRPYLLLGAAAHEQDYALLRDTGVTHILQIGSELRASFPDRFQYLRIAIEDAEHEDIIRQLPRCFKFIDAARGRTDADAAAYAGNYDDSGCGTDAGSDGVSGPRAAAARPAVVLVHCMAGMSRSASVVVSYLMWSERLPYNDAFQQVKAARPCIYPNLGFLLQLWEWEEGGCQLQSWPGWGKSRFVEGLTEYRRAQAAHGLHPAVRVRLPMGPAGTAPAASGDSCASGTSGPPAPTASSSPAVVAVAAATTPTRPGGGGAKVRRVGLSVIPVSASASARSPAPHASHALCGYSAVPLASSPGVSAVVPVSVAGAGGVAKPAAAAAAAASPVVMVDGISPPAQSSPSSLPAPSPVASPELLAGAAACSQAAAVSTTAGGCEKDRGKCSGSEGAAGGEKQPPLPSVATASPPLPLPIAAGGLAGGSGGIGGVGMGMGAGVVEVVKC